MSQEVLKLLDVISLFKESIARLDEISHFLSVNFRNHITETDTTNLVSHINAIPLFLAIRSIQNKSKFFNIQPIYPLHIFFLKMVFLQRGLLCI